MHPRATKKQDSRGRYYGYSADRKHSTGRARKRRRTRTFYKKKETTSENEKNVENQSTSSSQSGTTNRIIDIGILFRELENAICCSKCHNGRVHISESNTEGLGFRIDLTCEKCGHVAAINSCQKVGQMNDAWETNSRSVLAMRVLGHGHTDLLTFCGIMDLPTPVEQSAFTAINDHLSKVCEEASQSAGNVTVKEEVDSPPSPAPCEIFDVFEKKCEVIENIKLENNDVYDCSV